jgi:hypothetical protein
MVNKTLDIKAAIASLPLCERDAFEERCKRYSNKIGLKAEDSEVQEAVYMEMYQKMSNCNS